MINRSSIQSILRSFSSNLFQENEPALEERARKKLFAIFLIIIGVPLFIVGVNHMRTGMVTYGMVNILYSIMLFGLVLAMNRIGRGIVYYRLVSISFWLLLAYWVYMAPRNGYASIWAILYPVFVFFLLGKREGMIWSLSMILMCAFFFYNPFNVPMTFRYPDEFSWRHLLALGFVIFLTYYYESVRVDYKNALDRDRKELKEHRDNLEALVDERTDELQRKNMELNRALEQLRERTAQYLKSQIEKEKIQEQLTHSQKMEAVGTLAGGLAHDFNNLLGGIIGSFNLIDMLMTKEKLENRKEIEEYLNLGIEASKKSTLIIKQLLTLSRRQKITLVPVDINTSLRNVLSICQNSFAKSIVLDFRFVDIPIIVMADPVYIEQVILNLCINAAHAMTTMRGAHGVRGGTLTVVPDIAIPDEDLMKAEPETARASSWARIRVIDTGVGIPEENLARIFDPFFTTKKDEGGSGLGLAMSYGIIKQHGGFISVGSEVGKGSTLSVYIPLTLGRDASAAEKAGPVTVSARARSGHIMVVDDEAYIRDVVSGILTAYGWKVLAAGTPDQGLELFRDRQGEISAVLLDLSMPGRSGIELYGELSAIDPGVKVILCSGLIDDAVREGARAAGIQAILNKPFDAETLIRTIDRVLGGD